MRYCITHARRVSNASLQIQTLRTHAAYARDGRVWINGSRTAPSKIKSLGLCESSHSINSLAAPSTLSKLFQILLASFVNSIGLYLYKIYKLWVKYVDNRQGRETSPFIRRGGDGLLRFVVAASANQNHGSNASHYAQYFSSFSVKVEN